MAYSSTGLESLEFKCFYCKKIIKGEIYMRVWSGSAQAIVAACASCYNRKFVFDLICGGNV